MLAPLDTQLLAKSRICLQQIREAAKLAQGSITTLILTPLGVPPVLPPPEITFA